MVRRQLLCTLSAAGVRSNSCLLAAARWRPIQSVRRRLRRHHTTISYTTTSTTTCGSASGHCFRSFLPLSLTCCRPVRRPRRKQFQRRRVQPGASGIRSPASIESRPRTCLRLRGNATRSTTVTPSWQRPTTWTRLRTVRRGFQTESAFDAPKNRRPARYVQRWAQREVTCDSSSVMREPRGLRLLCDFNRCIFLLCQRNHRAIGVLLSLTGNMSLAAASSTS